MLASYSIEQWRRLWRLEHANVNADVAAALRQTDLRLLAIEGAEYAGPSSGIEVLPDERCEPLRFEFGIDQVAQDFVKTQFAGLDAHSRC